MFYFVLALLVYVPGSAPVGLAPEAVADTVRPRHVTLAGWDRRVRRAVWDRGRAYGGYYHDRGLLRQWTPQMDHEYDLDLASIQPSLADDAAFYATDHGFRISAGSIETVRFVLQSELRAETPLVGPLGLEVGVVQQEDLQAERAAVVLGYLVDLGRGHRLGARHSFASQKMDIDAEVVYRFARPWLDAELSLGRLDIVNDIVNETLDPVPQQAEVLRVYDGATPWLASRLSAPAGPVRIEAAGGMAPTARADVRSQVDEQVRFRFDSGFAFGGALVEAEVWGPALVVGVTARGTRSVTQRVTPPDVEARADYTARQTSLGGGVFALGRWRSVRAEASWRRERRTDRQAGTAFAGSTVGGPYDIDERWTWTRLRLDWVPGRTWGPTVGAEYIGALRRFPVEEDFIELRHSVMPALVNPSHHRLTARAGFRFSPRADVVFGANLDLDLDPSPVAFRAPRVYDGGYVRLRAVW